MNVLTCDSWISVVVVVYRTKIKQRKSIQRQPPVVLRKCTSPCNRRWIESNVWAIWYGSWFKNSLETGTKNYRRACSTELWFHNLWRPRISSELSSKHGKLCSLFFFYWNILRFHFIRLTTIFNALFFRFRSAAVLPRKFFRWPKIECWREESSYA